MAPPPDSTPTPPPRSPRPTGPGREPSASYADLMKPDEDWTNLPNAAERRKIQNRLAQRAYRRSLRERNKEVERLKKQVQQLEASQAQRQAGTIPAEQDPSASLDLHGSPEPASSPRPRHPTPPTPLASDWMGDYLQGWEQQGEPEEQSFWALMDDQVEPALSNDLLDTNMVQSPVAPAVPGSAARCALGSIEVLGLGHACSQHPGGDSSATGNKSTIASPHMLVSPPLSNRSRNSSHATTPSLLRDADPTDLNLYEDRDNDNGLGMYVADASNHVSNPAQPLADDFGPRALHLSSPSSSSTSHLTDIPVGCFCRTRHVHTSTPSASLQLDGGVRKAEQKPPDTNTRGPQLPLIQGLVVGRGTHITGHDNQTAPDQAEQLRQLGCSYVSIQINWNNGREAEG